MPYCKKCGCVYQIKNIKHSEKDSVDSFVCSQCGYNEPIKSGTVIYTKQKLGSQNTDNEQPTRQFFDVDYKTINPTLLRTRNYLCPNKECQTHAHPELRNAVLERDTYGSYTMRYICCVCHTVFVPTYLAAKSEKQ